jgi:hypothetical protein
LGNVLIWMFFCFGHGQAEGAPRGWKYGV